MTIAQERSPASAADADESKPAPAPSDAGDGLALPSLEALVAGTVALMTAHAHPGPDAALPPAQLKGLLARKVVSNLFFLMQHPLASAALRQSLTKAHARWQQEVSDAAARTEHRTPPAGQRLH